MSDQPIPGTGRTIEEIGCELAELLTNYVAVDLRLSHIMISLREAVAQKDKRIGLLEINMKEDRKEVYAETMKLNKRIAELEVACDRFKASLVFYGDQENYRSIRLDADHGGMHSAVDGD